MPKKHKKLSSLLNSIDKKKDFSEKDIKVRWEEGKKYQNVNNKNKLNESKRKKRSFFKMDCKKVSKLISRDTSIIKIIRIKYKKFRSFYRSISLLNHYTKNTNRNIKIRS
jgi:hypothetical protein